MQVTIPHPPKTIFEVWESLPEGTLCQLINNNLVMSPSPLDIHQVVLMEIFFEFRTFLNKSKLGKLRIAPYDVHFSKQNILQPDITFIKNENLNKIKERGIFGAPDLVIEILSPSTYKYDMEDKKLIYERYGVQEYFIVDPQSGDVYAFKLEEGEFVEAEMETGKIISTILNTTIEF